MSLSAHEVRIREYKYSHNWDDIKFSLPTQIEIETISTCTRNCSYCPVSKFESSHHLMPEPQFKAIIDELADVGFIGNIGTAVLCEPLMDKRCIKLFSYAREKLPHSKIHLATNGDLLTPSKCAELLDSAFSTIRITQHDPEYKHEQEIGAFLKENPRYLNRVTILRPDFQEGLLNWAGVIPDIEGNPMYAEQCPFYSMSAIDAYGNVLLCCCDAYFARTEPDRNEPGFGNLKSKSLIEFWKESEPTRRKLYDGTHILDIELCQKCTGCGPLDYDKIMKRKHQTFVKRVLNKILRSL